MDMSIETVGLDALVVSLAEAGRKCTLESAKVLTKAAGNVRDGMKADFSGHSHAPRIPAAINYDARGLSFEVGVDKNGPQGGLGNLLAFGSSKNGAVVDHTAALRRELPALTDHLADVAQKSLQ